MGAAGLGVFKQPKHKTTWINHFMEHCDNLQGIYIYISAHATYTSIYIYICVCPVCSPPTFTYCVCVCLSVLCVSCVCMSVLCESRVWTSGTNTHAYSHGTRTCINCHRT